MLKVGTTITVSDDDTTTIFEVMSVEPDKKKKYRLYRLRATELDTNRKPYEILSWIPNCFVRGQC